MANGTLVLGWRVTSTLQPDFWLSPSAAPGQQRQDELVCVPAQLCAQHTAVVAQSGSGKSFFLGRFIEELLLRTKARCVVLDPNGDFSRVFQVQDESLWVGARYDIIGDAGKLPHEASKDQFANPWARLDIRVRTVAPRIAQEETPLTFWLPDISVEMLAEPHRPELCSEIYFWHTFLKAVARLMSYSPDRLLCEKNMIQQAEVLAPLTDKTITERKDMLAKVFQIRPGESDGRSAVKSPPKHGMVHSEGANSLSVTGVQEMTPADLWSIVDAAAQSLEYVTQEGRRLYFGRVRELEAAGILDTGVSFHGGPPEPRPRLEVVDISSLPLGVSRLLAANAVLESEWRAARNAWFRALRGPQGKDTRVPTFIILDEAHNLIPKECSTTSAEIVREQFRTIASEGRKYGLFLIFVTQRPDKIDPNVASECANKVIMRLASSEVLTATVKLLGLDDVPRRELEKCLNYGVSRGLLAGLWSVPGARHFYCAARRTVEGGRNLREAYWTEAE